MLNLRLCSSANLFTGLHHFLERVQRRSNQEIVITISENSHKHIVDPATSHIPSELDKEIIGIKAIEDTRQDSPLSNTILNRENTGKVSVPSYIGKLVHVDEQQESH